jgi:uncharacterized alkaline shock family protein YloU
VPEAIAGRALVTRRAVIDIVRRVTLGSYGVVGFSGGWPDRFLGALERRPGGMRISLRDGKLGIVLRLKVAHGLPIAEVARQVDASVRYAIRSALGTEVDRLAIRVARVAMHPASTPPPREQHPDPSPSELADSGTDVA